MTAQSNGERKLLRIEARNAETPIERKPEWIKTRARTGPEFLSLQALVKREGLHTVCQEAGCPNIYECWEDREATFLIGGEQCTRRCDFCQIDTGKPAPLDRDEPRRVAESVRTMQLRYATVTGVARDDLEDEGAWLYAETIRAIHELNPETGVEILIPDFSGNPTLLMEVFEAGPQVLAHNLETVPRLFRTVRPAFEYDRSLDVLTQARAFGLVTKSNLILGMGEEPDEVGQALLDLHDAGCDLVTITQYLRPSSRHRTMGSPRRIRGPRAGCARHWLPRSAQRPSRALLVSSRTPVCRGHRCAHRPWRVGLRPMARFSGIKSRFSTILENFRMAKSGRPTIGWEMAGIFLVVGAVVATPLSIFLNWPTGVILGVPAGAIAALFWFSRVAMRSAYKSIEGQPGAAAAVIESMRGNWSVTPAVAVTRNQDLVSRVVGRCGVILVGEGAPSRVVALLATERKKTARWLPDIPIYEMQVGTEEGQIRISRLQKEMGKLPKNLRPAESNDIRRRLDALSQRQNAIPLPKGPMPRQSR